MLYKQVLIMRPLLPCVLQVRCCGGGGHAAARGAVRRAAAAACFAASTCEGQEQRDPATGGAPRAA
jgi:hypothetical protein